MRGARGPRIGPDFVETQSLVSSGKRATPQSGPDFPCYSLFFSIGFEKTAQILSILRHRSMPTYSLLIPCFLLLTWRKPAIHAAFSRAQKKIPCYFPCYWEIGLFFAGGQKAIEAQRLAGAHSKEENEQQKRGRRGAYLAHTPTPYDGIVDHGSGGSVANTSGTLRRRVLALGH